MQPVGLYFDFVSPYTWLALETAGDFAARHDLTWELHPVVYVALLRHHGLVGPVETEAKRRYTFADVLRCASRLGLALEGPPRHPFRSIEALRVATLFDGHPRALELARSIAHAIWSEGRDPCDWGVLAAAAEAAGLPADDLEARCADAAVKQLLRASTDEAIAAGVFGIPTFRAGDTLFWGHDRLEHLADHLAGRHRPDPDRLERLVERPWGVPRPALPERDAQRRS